MRIRSAIIGAALAGAALFGTVGGSVAQATSTPVPVISNQVGGWGYYAVKPSVIQIGEGGTPYVTNLRWAQWRLHAGAFTNRGTVWIFVPGCHPLATCKPNSDAAQVRLWRPVLHKGHWYFSRMEWIYRSGGKVHDDYMQLNSHGFWFPPTG